LLGATFVGREAGAYLHPSTVAIVGKVPMSKLWHAVAAFPSMSEIYTTLLVAAEKSV
jgi:pyruvate/2-oxoglutarate dehydrogenase complex dihydrolipoamide dehydrogenase (E3) component